MVEIAELLTRIEGYCRENGVAESTFGRLAVNDGKLIPRLRSGKTITLEKYGQILSFLGAQATKRRA